MKIQKKTNTPSARGSFILMIGDEGAILVKITGDKVVRRIFALAPDEASTRTMEDLLQESPNYPVTLLFDFMDQSYVRQTLPPVSSFSVGKIIERRLNKDFSPDDIKGYVILDREKTGRRDWNYLMVSLPNNALLQKWIGFAVERENPFKGMGLVPVEVQSMMKAIEKNFLKAKGKNAKPLEWNILVSHNKVGGFRQVVLKNGKLILTRMAQPVGESSPDVVAGNIEQEIINTLEYLKRLGLQDHTSVSITVICAEEIKKFLDTNTIKVEENHFFTPYEAAEALGLKEAAQPNDHFGDIIISSFVARQKKLLLRLGTKYTQKVTRFYSYFKYIKICIICIFLGFMGFAGFNGYDIFTTRNEIEEIENKEKQLNNELNKLKNKSTETVHKDLDYYVDIMGIIRPIKNPQLDILNFITRLSTAIGKSALIRKIEWSLPDPLKFQKDADTRQIEAHIESDITLPHEPKSAYSPGVNQFITRINKKFYDFTVTHDDIPGITSEIQEIKSVIGENGNIQEASALIQPKDKIHFIMKGPIKPLEGSKGTNSTSPADKVKGENNKGNVNAE